MFFLVGGKVEKRKDGKDSLLSSYLPVLLSSYNSIINLPMPEEQNLPQNSNQLPDELKVHAFVD